MAFDTLDALDAFNILNYFCRKLKSKGIRNELSEYSNRYVPNPAIQQCFILINKTSDPGYLPPERDLFSYPNNYLNALNEFLTKL